MKQTRLSFCREETGGILHWKHYPVYCSHLNSLQERVFIVSCLGIALDHIILLLRVVSEGKGGCLSRQPPPPWNFVHHNWHEHCFLFSEL